ncbi:MAG: hypothetical protein ACREL7_17040 [Longimicrobiales bacterium]
MAEPGTRHGTEGLLAEATGGVTGTIGGRYAARMFDARQQAYQRYRARCDMRSAAHVAVS